jgi:hypothetical protein
MKTPITVNVTSYNRRNVPRRASRSGGRACWARSAARVYATGTLLPAPGPQREAQIEHAARVPSTGLDRGFSAARGACAT